MSTATDARPGSSGWVALRRFGWLVVAVTLACAAMAVVWTKLQAPVYSASASVLVGPSTSASPANGDIVSESEVASQRIVATSEPVLLSAAASLGDDVGAADLRKAVHVEPIAGTRVLTFTARRSSAEVAAAWADAVARAYAVERVAQAAAVDRTRDQLNRESARLTAEIEDVEAKLDSREDGRVASLEATRRLLEARIDTIASRLEALPSVDATASATVLNPASVPGTPAEPKPVLYTCLATAFGLLLGIAAALVAGQLVPDRRRAGSEGTLARTVADGLPRRIDPQQLHDRA